MITKILQTYDEDYIYSLLEPEVASWFKRKFKHFTEPQKYALVEVHKKNNILISSPTGSGKTLAAFLSIINKLIKLKKEGKLEDRIYAIYISPLRALNNDIKRNLEKPLKGIERRAKRTFDIRIAVRTSDTSAYEKSKMLKKPPHILITTPETFSIAINAPRFSSLMKGAEYVIIDEIHSLASNKRGSSLSLALERLAYNNEFTRVGLSATIHPLKEVAKFLVGQKRSCKIADVSYEKKMELEVLTPVDDFIYTPPNVINKKLYEIIDKLIDEHSTTLIFTNTRGGTERVLYHLRDYFGEKYIDSISAHHSSLSREIRLETEKKLKQGEIKAVVSSTSLELGIDIGSIDLVILLGSPKSVSRAVQRVGRSGHKLHDISKGVMIALDRDDLMEMTLIAYNARKRRFDKIRIPEKPLDVLIQHVLGMALEKKWNVDEALKLIKKAYPYRNLTKEELISVLRYLSGSYSELEARKVYGKIWFEDNMFGRRGKMARAIYYMNSGTIPETTSVPVFNKKTKAFIGKLDEAFVERLMPGDIFILGGKNYLFVGNRGNKIYVENTNGQPTIPIWVSEMLPLSYELALDIERFREELKDASISQISKKYGIDKKAAKALISYTKEQMLYAAFGKNDFLVEEYTDEEGVKNYIFHSCAGRKANEALARAFAYFLGDKKKINIRVTLNDYGFVLSTGRWRRLKEEDIKDVLSLSYNEFIDALKKAIDGSELLRRRFREIAARSLLILKKYPGRDLTIAKQQVNADALFRLIRFYYSEDFPVIKETYREIFNDFMHIDEAWDYLKRIKKRHLIFKRNEKVPSPFAFNLIASGNKDVIMIEDKRAFIKRLHEKLMHELGGNLEENKEY